VSTTWVPGWFRHAGKLVLSARVRQDALWEWRRRRHGPPALPTGSITNVLVVCHGNLCRSPFAASLLAEKRSDLSVRSAGLFASEGEPADSAALRVARQFGVALDAHRTQRVSDADLAWSHLVLGMEGHHAVWFRRFGPEQSRKTLLLGDFLPEPPHRLEDPWGLGDEVFAMTFERIGSAVQRLAQVLEPSEL